METLSTTGPPAASIRRDKLKNKDGQPISRDELRNSSGYSTNSVAKMKRNGAGMIGKTRIGNVAMMISDAPWKSRQDYGSNNRTISVNSWSDSVTISNAATTRAIAGAGTRVAGAEIKWLWAIYWA